MKKIIWIQKTGLVEIVLCGIRSLFSESTVNYDERNISLAARYFLMWMKKFGLCKNFYSISFSGDKKDPIGCTLYYKIYKEMIVLVENFNSEYVASEPLWFKKMVAAFLHNYNTTPLYFITMVEEEIVFEKDTEHVVCISCFPVNILIKKFYIPAGFRIQTICNLKEIIKHILNPFYILFMLLLHQMRGVNFKTNIEKIKPSIWVEYDHKTTLSFWRDYVKAEEFDLVYYLDRSDIRITEETIEKCKSHKFKWVDLKKIYLARLNVNDFKEIVSQLFIYNKKHPLWLHFLKFHFVVLSKIYSNIFRHFEVKILMQHQEVSWVQQAQADAIKSVGGIMVGSHWSAGYPFDMPFFPRPEHVYFVWGKFMYEYLERNGHTIRFVLPCGLWMLQKEKKRKENLFPGDINFIIAIFDATATPWLYQTPDALSKFYLMILNLIEKNPGWGGIIKPKLREIEGLHFLPFGEQIVSKIKTLIKKKKLVYLSFLDSPGDVSDCADLAVGFCLQTAAIIGGIYAVKIVMWDTAGWLKHPFYRDAEQKFVFPSLDEVEQAIIKVSKGDKFVGDFSAWRKAFNYYDDFDAPKRVGKFIQDFMETVIETDDANHSLEYAVKRYTEENRIGDDFFESCDWWE